MPSLISLCGRIGSGKSMTAAYLKQLGTVVVLNVDKLMHPLFGDSMDRHLFDRSLRIIIRWMADAAQQILDAGVSVVLDFGFWTRENRKQVVTNITGHPIWFLYLDIDEEIQLDRVLGRNNSEEKTYTFDMEALTILNDLFQEPDVQEGILLKKSDSHALLTGACDDWVQQILFDEHGLPGRECR